MATFERRAESIWEGDLRTGKGKLTTDSKVLHETAYGFNNRFENEPGTNPEELLAAAHAGCFNMALSNTLVSKGYKPERLSTTATCTVASKEGGGFAITTMALEVEGKVPDLSEDAFAEIVGEADRGCPVSVLLRPGLTIEVKSKLV